MKRRGLSTVMAVACSAGAFVLRASIARPAGAGSLISYAQKRERLRMTVSWHLTKQLFPKDISDGYVKTVLLLRHAKSAWDDTGLGDHESPLRPPGERGAQALG